MLYIVTEQDLGGGIGKKFLMEGTSAESISETFFELDFNERLEGEPLIDETSVIGVEPVEFVKGVCEI